jgi:hypothetical protein
VAVRDLSRTATVDYIFIFKEEEMVNVFCFLRRTSIQGGGVYRSW